MIQLVVETSVPQAGPLKASVTRQSLIMEGSFSRKQALERALIDHVLNSIGIADVLAIGEQLRDNVQSSLQDHFLQKQASC